MTNVPENSDSNNPLLFIAIDRFRKFFRRLARSKSRMDIFCEIDFLLVGSVEIMYKPKRACVSGELIRTIEG